MAHRFSASVFTGLLVVLAAPLAAQMAPDSTSVIQRAHGLAAQGGTLQGGGADYAVVFDGRGLELTPALGAGAPRNYPVRFTLESVRRGNETIWTGPRDAAPRLVDNSAIYQRGAGIVERYDVLPEGVEQSFTFREPLTGSGALVVRGRIETELSVADRGRDGELRLLAGEHGGVTIGGVTGIDAAGRRAAGELRFDGTHLDLVLPATFVDTAAYPLVLDPLIGPEIKLGGGSTSESEPDVAYDFTQDVYLVVWQRQFSSSLSRIRAQRIDSTGGLVGSLLLIQGLQNVQIRPTVANVMARKAFLVVWQGGPSMQGPWDLAGCGVDPATGTTSQTRMLVNNAGDEIEPDAATNISPNDSAALLVWTEQPVQAMHRIMIARVILTGFLDPILTTTFRVSEQPATVTPAISNRGAPNYLVVWQRGGSSLVGRMINSVTLTPLTPVWGVASQGSLPAVDGDGTDFLVAYQREESPRSTSHDLLCRAIQYDSAFGWLRPGPETVVEADPRSDEREAAVAYLDPKYVVAWADQRAGSSEYDLAVKALDPATCGPCGLRETVTGSRSMRSPAMAVGTRTWDEAMIVYAAIDTATSDGDMRAQRYELFATGGFKSRGGGCTGGGQVGTTGEFALGNSNFAFELQGASFFATGAILDFNVPSAQVVKCGPCKVMIPLISVPCRIQNGQASCPVPVPCDPSLVGATLQVQWLTTLPMRPPCPLLGGLAFSDRVDATVGY